MAHSERNALAGLRIETSFHQQRSGWPEENDPGRRRSAAGGDGIESDRTKINHDHNAHCRDANEDRSVLSEMHSATPPISVPRAEGRSQDNSSYPDRPDDIQGSPLDNYLETRRSSITFNPKVSLESGLQRPLDEPLAKGDARNRTPLKFESRTSGLRNALSQDDDSMNSISAPWGDDSKRSNEERGIPTGASRERHSDSMPGTELDQPTSLTSLSTVSPIAEEVRTPPGSVKDSLLSPLYITSPTQSFASPEDRSASWSGGLITPFGSKSRRSTLDRSSSLRSSATRNRRSTNSSGKSPASTFLSMWSTKDEPAASPDDEGQMVGTDYVLGKQIGFGGFSIVKEAYKVEEHGATKRLAVKIVKKNVTERSERENEEVQAEFDHEVRVWRYLNHPHVLTLDAVYETDFATFCFTKLAIGGTLFDLVRQNRQGLDMMLAKKYTYQLACAIRYLHEDARVVHRDIKLENCLLDPIESSDGTTSSTLVLCDFGMAEWMTTDDGGVSPDPYDEVADRPPPKQMGPADSSTSVAGSLEYASPELLESVNGIIHPSVDIWAFGVIVYTMIVGSRPFQDSFAPRITSNILSGTWNREAILNGVTDELLLRDRQDALDLVINCLEMNFHKRWTIRDILASSWLREVAESTEESSPDSVWKL
ncbi:uncharacterized protein N7473_010508 [Penicillium subrubescens]|uniref:Serine/threonine-protein kinase MARK2 n=1 Tax=Penicillium subrubescens TaxID=1316194 RepID=A0A1Q5SZK9_9EURO|nr:uncharacterized protein N7473_010508 [Penicillium subrubescens]KAJ5883622.1 hypothetical protein N7473_010508 [Penicillium subrubescens]OKO93372.1 Serine/threonine-protein kinase MARK2 [Penicillium subrubescens]